MNDGKFVYVTYIATTPAKVWDALVEGELARQYWKNENISDWKPGSSWKHVAGSDRQTVLITGQVVESLPGRRLVLTWAEPGRESDTARHSRVAIDIETVGRMVRLTIAHEQVDAEMLPRITNGWPRVLSSLKSFLETGQPLDTWA